MEKENIKKEIIKFLKKQDRFILISGLVGFLFGLLQIIIYFLLPELQNNNFLGGIFLFSNLFASIFIGGGGGYSVFTEFILFPIYIVLKWTIIGALLGFVLKQIKIKKLLNTKLTLIISFIIFFIIGSLLGLIFSGLIMDLPILNQVNWDWGFIIEIPFFSGLIIASLFTLLVYILLKIKEGKSKEVRKWFIIFLKAFLVFIFVVIAIVFLKSIYLQANPPPVYNENITIKIDSRISQIEGNPPHWTTYPYRATVIEGGDYKKPFEEYGSLENGTKIIVRKDNGNMKEPEINMVYKVNLFRIDDNRTNINGEPKYLILVYVD